MIATAVIVAAVGLMLYFVLRLFGVTEVKAEYPTGHRESKFYIKDGKVHQGQSDDEDAENFDLNKDANKGNPPVNYG